MRPLERHTHSAPAPRPWTRVWDNTCRAMGIICLAVVLSGALFPDVSGADTPPPVVSKITVEILGPEEGKDRLAAFARGIILLREGEPFSGEALAKSIDLLKSSRLFQAIDVPDPEEAQGRMALAFRLTPFRRIKEIHIHGAFPLLQKEVLNAMTIYTGDAYVAEKLEKQEALVEKTFETEGYPDARVRVTSEEDPDDGHFEVTVTIEKGIFNRIQHVEILGNKGFSSARLKLRLDTWKVSLFYGEIPRFIQKKLDDDVENLKKFYRAKGYADVEITPEVEHLSDPHDITIRFKVTEGKKYVPAFEGNTEFWGWTLKRELAYTKEGNRSDLGLKKSIRNIRTRYQKAGYLDVRVRMSETEATVEGIKERDILFTIEEGPRYVAHAIDIQGNTVFDRERIDKQMLTRLPGTFSAGEFVPEVLEEDISAIQSLYLSKGYLDTAVDHTVTFREDPETGQKLTDIALVINEGMQTRVTAVAFNGLDALTPEEARAAIALKEGEPFREYMIKSDENTLSEEISEQGYPHIAVKGSAQVETADDGSGQATVAYDITEGRHVKTGEVFYTGNFRTKERILKREVELTPEEPFSLTKTLETQRNIRNIAALSAAHFRTIGLKEEAPEVNLLVEVEERKPYYFELGLGYDTRRKKYAHTRLGDRNLFGQNKDGWISAETSEIGYRTELGITEPRFLGTRVSATFSMFGEKLEEFNQDFGTRTYGSSLTFNRRFLEDFNASLNNRYEYREQYRVGSTPIPPEDAEQYEPRSIVVVTPALTYNSTDSFVRPRKGMIAFGALDISQGIENNLDDFFKHRYELRFYKTPFSRLTFALRGRVHHIIPYGSNDNIPEDQLLFLGGTSDIRGYSENKFLVDDAGDPVGGRTSILGSLEARFDLGLNVEFTTFFDTGSIRSASDPDLSESFRSSAGAGLRYVTPIGPVGFLYGWKLDRQPGESSGELHFSIGYTF
ncbi:outer membrane protein assembly factor BamA [Desulfoluna spongiiphila]|uniref:Outer membrane protein assembly factor BamA n=1 Tax=Desulfoluna spongiiphila TaxID=419481 RepID=A0A1G5IM10_9BACT|nr:outer membrane protein assembly factor BamA [Desulfoluna spongiiphila]SCY76458.1 Beta-barrel assembly machine subunit BamA [Desulfoluna spongiiphila]